jgi:hypothetical protein
MRHFLDKIGYPTIATVLGAIIFAAITAITAITYHFGWFSHDPPPLIPRTLQELLHIGKGKMSVERDRLLSPYLGQPIKVSVEVDNVSSYYGTITVYVPIKGEPLLGDRAFYTASLNFLEAKWGNRLRMLSKGDQITATCIFKDADAVNVYLDGCDLIN